MAGLLLFVTLYCALAGWFLYTAYQVIIGGAGSDLGAFAWIMAACSLFIGVFMVKAIFSVKNAKPTDLHEITAKDQPRLFAFLYELADAAGAPRPHKVFLSARVNAAVFYDLSLFNLIVPSKKNLEIGLALVNTVSLGELRAVLAHEFGHFAQRSMAVGRWVYVAQQIATHLVTRRDALDDFLVSLGRVDIRIYFGVAVVQLIIWSIRSLVESLFNVVVMMQRALSREMEMQADLVAVSLTGSDALIHALHKLQGADDAWDRALHFVFGERGAGRATGDVFAVQTHMIARMSAILNDDGYARVPPLPEQDRERHRVFKREMAQPPKMWLTHPLNHEREENAKRIYIPAAIDPVSAWSLFDYPELVRRDMTARLLEGEEAKQVELEESLKTLGRQFKREQFNRRYCGIFFGRSLGRHTSDYKALRSEQHCASLAELPRLYPDSLAQDVQLLRSLETQHAQLRALIAGTMTAPGKRVVVRGVEFRKKDLPAARDSVGAELEAVRERLRSHDKLCRSWHQGHARTMGGQWQAYLDGLLAIIHYAEHSVAEIEDLQGMLNNTTAVVTAVRNINADGVSRVVCAANELHHALETAYRTAARVELDERLRERLKIEGSFGASLGEFSLELAQNDSINAWLGVVDSWVAFTVNALTALRSAALDELLLTETMVARHAREGGEAAPAPAPSRAPASYPVLLDGAERKRQTRLGWWARFQRADGLLPGTARLAVAGAIVAAVLGASTFNQGHGSSMFSDAPALLVFNGLDIPVTAAVDGHSVSVAPRSMAPLALPAFGFHKVEARSPDGRLIESFEATAVKGGHPVYNVAGAAPLVEWTATYGSATERPARHLGTVRWLDSGADFRFSKPPEQVSGRSSNYRTVLDAATMLAPELQLEMLPDAKDRQRLALLHMRWDPTDTRNIQAWIDAASGHPGFGEVLTQRLHEAPDDVLLLREQYSAAAEAQKKTLCTQAAANAAAAPADGNRKYLALRCQDDSPELVAQTAAAFKRWPDNPWLGYTVAYHQLEAGDYAAALQGLELARTKLPARAALLVADIGRTRRYLDPKADLSALTDVSPYLAYLVQTDTGVELAPDSPRRAHVLLAVGQLEQALKAVAKGDASDRANVLRRVAASDGATKEMVARAQALGPDEGIDIASAWLRVGMTIRDGGERAAHRAAAVAVTGRYGETMGAFLDSAVRGGDPRAAERLLDQTPPVVRGYAYSAAIVALRRKAPAEWRQFVQRMMFASEKPYFRQS